MGGDKKRKADGPAAGSPAATKAKATSQTKEEFTKVYYEMRDEILDDPLLAGQPKEAREWLKEMLDYNVPGGKLNRGMAVLDALCALLDREPTAEEVKDANVAGWCIELLQAFFLVADDIMDGSVTRRGQPCWYKVPKVGMIACNDCILLEAAIYNVLRRRFRGRACYVHLLDLFHEVTFQTSHGQQLDLITAPIGQKNLERYTLDTYLRIVTFKTAFYTFYLPVALGMRLAGVEDEGAYRVAQDICIEMGQYFQIQDDYLDCYGDPEVIGKVGTDIEDSKCSWLVVNALERATPAQRKVVQEHYGRPEKEHVAKIKALYREMGLEALFKKYEEESHKELVGKIEGQTKVPAAVFMPLLKKIYKRSK
ncbi:unnamed protein product [Pedinophyceae sp. YPF-701]|nr:unnamed protein product [Pedinophyceae sp. YPF-701]